jgi:hypothetical protein
VTDIYSISKIDFFALNEFLLVLLFPFLQAFLLWIFIWIVREEGFRSLWRKSLLLKGFVFFLLALNSVMIYSRAEICVVHLIGHERQKRGVVQSKEGAYRFIRTHAHKTFYYVGDMEFQGSQMNLPCFPGATKYHSVNELDGSYVRIWYTVIYGYTCVTKVSMHKGDLLN